MRWSRAWQLKELAWDPYNDLNPLPCNDSREKCVDEIAWRVNVVVARATGWAGFALQTRVVGTHLD